MSIFFSRKSQRVYQYIIPSLSGLAPHTTKRYESSSRRTTKRLRTKTDPSFTSSIPQSQLNDHIVFNPPSSAPSPFHTPPAFLPVGDPRRKLLAQSHQHANPYDDEDRHLPPLIPGHKPYEKKYHLGEKEIEEIRRLRTEDPNTWSRKRLADKFECSPYFVGLVCPASKEKVDQDREVIENIKAKWGRRKTYAREDRDKRRQSWGRDE